MNLKYRIHSISSQNPQHPASDLLNGNFEDSQQQNMKYSFWESQITPKYPQEITLQFYIPVRTKNMQITFHPYKIPSKLQVFVRCAKNQKYQKLGFITPSDNLQSNFLQKQRKTLFFQYPCTFIKIIMHQNYRNNRNLFDQVAIWEIKLQGECLPASEIANLDYNYLEAMQTDQDEDESQVSKSSHISMGNNEEQSTSRFKQNAKDKLSTTSALFPEVFKMLESAKIQAVENQDFEKASQIKNVISRFKNIEQQIVTLQEEKRKALQDEDYDKCHRLKNQILKKKDLANHHLKQLQDHNLQNISEAYSRVMPQNYHPPPSVVPKNNNNFLSNRSNAVEKHEDQRLRSPIPNRKSNTNNQNNNISYTSRTNNPANQSNIYGDYESQVVPALKKKIQAQFNSVSKINQSVSYENNVSLNQGYSNRNITQESRNNQNNPQQYIEESIDLRNYEINQIISDHPKLEHLDFKDEKKYQIYFDYIQPDLWRMALTQQYWKLKGYALDRVLQLQINQGIHIQAILQLVSVIIEDTHPINVKKCLHSLQKLIYLQSKDVEFDLRTSNHKHYIQIILVNLLHLLTDTKQQFRKLSSEIYKNLPDFSIFPLQQSIRFIIKSNHSLYSNNNIINNNKNNKKFTPKQLLPKINLIQYFVITYHDAQVYFTQIIKWAIGMLQDPDSNVKSAAMKLLLEISLRNKKFYLQIKQEIMKKKSKNQLWANFEAYYEEIQAVFEEQQGDKNTINQQSEQDIHNKETMLNRKKKIKNIDSLQYSHDDAQQSLKRLQESPIPTPNKQMKQSAEIQLAYSQQSIFRNSQSHVSHQWFAHKNQGNEEQLRVMEPLDNELQGLCDYCFQQIGTQGQLAEHLLENCPVLLPCSFCNGQVYLRELNQHWLYKCSNKYHQQCPRCLTAFQIDEINEHIARKICRKVNSNSNIQICPLCYNDVEGDDLAWVDHSRQCEGVLQIKQRSQAKAKALSQSNSYFKH